MQFYYKLSRHIRKSMNLEKAFDFKASLKNDLTLKQGYARNYFHLPVNVYAGNTFSEPAFNLRRRQKGTNLIL